MASDISSCPTEDQLSRLLDGGLADADGAALTAHLDSCVTCRQALDRLAGACDSWPAVAAALQGGERAVDGPALRPMLERLRNAGTTTTTRDLPALPLGSDQTPGPVRSDAELPARLGPYEVRGLVGEGGMGRVYLAFDPALHRVVALKVLNAALSGNAAARKRFQREARAAAAVIHEHVVVIHAVAEEADQPYLVMQYVAGKSLQDRLDRAGPLPLPEVLRIGLQVAEGLAAAHAQGLVHRDVKPSNILLEDEVERVKLTDFGLARAIDDTSLSQNGVIAGTPLYMSPEQAEGEAVDARSDLFSLGTVLYVLCTGRPPFSASGTMAVLKRVCEDTPRPIREINPDVPPWLCDLITRLHAKKPQDRYQSAAEVVAVLGRQLARLQAGEAPETILLAPPAPRRRPRWVRVVGALVILLLAGGLGLWLGLYRNKAADDGGRADTAPPLVSGKEKGPKESSPLPVAGQQDPATTAHIVFSPRGLDIVGEDLDGRPLKMSDYRGKVVVLAFWADWCPFCRKCFPLQKEMVRKLAGRPFAMLGVNADTSKAIAKAAVRRGQLNWPSWYIGKDGMISKQWGVSGLPWMILIDQNGEVRQNFNGYSEKIFGAFTQEAEELIRAAEKQR